MSENSLVFINVTVRTSKLTNPKLSVATGEKLKMSADDYKNVLK
jgi:hypothetical protein